MCKELKSEHWRPLSLNMLLFFRVCAIFSPVEFFFPSFEAHFHKLSSLRGTYVRRRRVTIKPQGMYEGSRRMPVIVADHKQCVTHALQRKNKPEGDISHTCIHYALGAANALQQLYDSGRI